MAIRPAGISPACMVATDWKKLEPEAPADLVPAGYSISGLFDLDAAGAGRDERRTCELDEAEARAGLAAVLAGRRAVACSTRWSAARESSRVPAPEPHRRRRLGQATASRRATRRSPAPTISPCSTAGRSEQRDGGALAELARTARIARKRIAASEPVAPGEDRGQQRADQHDHDAHRHGRRRSPAPAARRSAPPTSAPAIITSVAGQRTAPCAAEHHGAASAVEAASPGSWRRWRSGSRRRSPPTARRAAARRRRRRNSRHRPRPAAASACWRR